MKIQIGTKKELEEMRDYCKGTHICGPCKYVWPACTIVTAATGLDDPSELVDEDIDALIKGKEVAKC